ncbi:DnaB-like helicase N-terminal domain-containing protein [Kineosporia babensis]|uniref:DNA helicase DnaB-like N-terminal domain-containing protein n=1 Tax=Kineosporia babensis TaxID=499548 RepID=A0A9X1NN76_9ACTN|nr:DnaB-like helicase N-terminal domain-containing protein [Kineosporia babensis]MCD5316173.1 hypothetical protein [Kineosporia babensis]
MSSVTLRAEQALLGALLTQQKNEHTAAMRLLEATDFGQRLHRHVFTAIQELRTTEPHLNGPGLVDAVAERIGSEPSTVQALADSAPAPAHADAYAQMIQTAAFRREIADASQAFAHNIATTSTSPADVSIEPGPAQAPSDSVTTAEDPHRARLLAALERQVEIYSTLANTPDTLTQTPANPSPDPGTITSTTPRSATAEPELVSSTDTPDRPQDASVGERVRLEDELLADLLRNPDQSDVLATFVADSTFTSGQRREMYQTILITAHAGQPIDDVIIAWQVELQRAANRLNHNTSPAPEPPTIPGYTPGAGTEPDLVYLTRLAATETPRTAIEIGQRLVTEDMTKLLRENVPQPKAQYTPQPHPAAARSAGLQRRAATAQPVRRPSVIPLDPSLKPPAPTSSETQRPTPRTER